MGNKASTESKSIRREQVVDQVLRKKKEKEAAAKPTESETTKKKSVRVEEKARPESSGKSEVAKGTYRFQGSLPKLPIPDLDDSCNRFLETVQPLLDEEEFQDTAAAVEEFRSNLGPEMQRCLETYAADKENYVDAFWDDAYLLMDEPVNINVNPFFVLEDDPTPARNDQIFRSAQLIWSTCKVIRAIRNETFEVDMVRSTPLCMSQFKKLFGSARIPHGRGVGNDKIETCSTSGNIIVICRNQFYSLDVVTKDGSMILSFEQLMDSLMAIKEEAQEMDQSTCNRDAFGVLTSATRTFWAGCREELVNVSAENEQEVKVIDEALFVLCLDMTSPANLTEASRNALRGTTDTSSDGVENGTCMSRWYDKLQFIVAENGSASVCFEHTPADGHTVLRMVSDVFTDTIIRFAQTISGTATVKNHLQSVRYTRSGSKGSSLASLSESGPRKIEMELTSSLRDSIAEAHSNLLEVIEENKLSSLEYTRYGKKFIVSHNLSPDAFVQQAMMASVFKVTGVVENAYESVMTKQFLLGRTEAGRPVTKEAKAYVDLVNGEVEAEPKLVVSALRDAAKAHSAMTGRCGRGLGVDRHMYALRKAWKLEHPNDSLPRIFSTPGYEKLGVTILSTSNCGNPALKLFGFGPVSPNGIGIGYIIKESGLSFSLCSRAIPVEEVAESLISYLDNTRTLLQKDGQRISLKPSTLVRKVIKGKK